jgi:hypothetical protein
MQLAALWSLLLLSLPEVTGNGARTFRLEANPPAAAEDVEALLPDGTVLPLRRVDGSWTADVTLHEEPGGCWIVVMADIEGSQQFRRTACPFAELGRSSVGVPRVRF